MPLVLQTPAWLSPSLRERLGKEKRIEHSFRFSRAERKSLRKRKKIRVSEWSEKHRIVTLSSVPGKWKNELTPYLAGIMDASFFPSVQVIIVCKSPQTGCTEAVNNCVGYAADRDPGPVLYVYPDEMTARENARDRIIPMFESSPRLRTYLSGQRDDTSGLRIGLVHMPIYMAWARSAARLGNRPCKYVVNDEVDKYPEVTNKREADPLSLSAKRTVTYKWSRKIWKFSTPTVEKGNIWSALNKEAQVVFHFWVRCPSCGMSQVMKLGERPGPGVPRGGLRWPADERDPEQIESRGLAWYECEHCEARWTDGDRDKAVRMGEWRAGGMEIFAYLQTHRPRKIGFHLPAFLSYFVPLAEIAAAFLKGRADKTKLKDFCNNYLAEPWLEYTVERDEDRILALRDDRPRGLAPSGARISRLLAVVDTQDNGFWYEVRAFGWGFPLESWQIREGFIDADWRKIHPQDLQGRSFGYHPAFDPVRQVLWETEYQDSAGSKYLVDFALIDAMGHHTGEVYDFCRFHRGRILPLQGVQTMNGLWAITNIDTYPGTNRPIPGGVKLLKVNTTQFKNQLANKLEIAPDDPGAWHLHKECTRDWARQLTVEFVNDKGFWECPEGKPNHAWDLGVYALACAEYRQIKFLKAETDKKHAPEPSHSSGSQAGLSVRPPWFFSR